MNITNMLNEVTGRDTKTLYHSLAMRLMWIIRRNYIMLLSRDVIMVSRINYIEETFNCTGSMDMGCDVFISGWAHEQKVFSLPDEVDVMWGTGDTSIIMYQVHYYNTELYAGDTDSTNTTIYFTPKLRKYDSGIMTLGKIPPLKSIPPGIP
jgi:hypothetical protein